MRQMACHPDLVLRSKNNAGVFVQDEAGEGTVCRLCNEFAEDAIQAKCRHIFDRECIKQYLEASVEPMVRRAKLAIALPMLTDPCSLHALFVTSRSPLTLRRLPSSWTRPSQSVKVSSAGWT